MANPRIDRVDCLSLATQDMQLRLRISLLEQELEVNKTFLLEAERRAAAALQAQSKAERDLEQVIEMSIEASRATEDAIHAQMEAEQRAELAVMEAERAKQAQSAAEKTAEIALIEAEVVQKQSMKRTGLSSSETCSLGPAEALEQSLPSSEGDTDTFSLPVNLSQEGRASQVINEQVLASMCESAARKEYDTTFKHIISGSTLATCGAGLKVVAISCGFGNDFIEIHNLPLDMEADNIASLLSSMDTPSIVTDTWQCGNGTISAMILIKAGKKQTVVNQIHGRTIRGHVLRANVVGAKWITQLRAPYYELQFAWEPHANDTSPSVELKKLLKSSPGLISFQFTACSPTGMFTAATARFDSWSSANSAHAQLGGMGIEQGFLSLKCDLRPNQPTRHILRIPLNQHYIFENEDAVKKQGMSMTSEEQGMIVQTDYLGSDWFDGWLWSSDPTTKELMEQILSQKEMRIHRITQDWLSRTLTFHAESQQAVDAASTAIRVAVARSKLVAYQTRISRRLVRSLQESDVLDSLRTEPGPGAVSLDVVCSHFVLKYRGGYSIAAMEKIAAKENPESESAEEMASCPICLVEVVEPIGLGCGHEYCAACLRRYLITAPERNRFPITCIGNDDMCHRPVAIPIIQTVLSIPEFRHLVDKAASSYVNQHPNELKYCPTPGCTQIYRSSKDKKALICPSCTTSVCSTCNTKGHPGRTCPEQRACIGPNEHERLDSIWASRNGAKECPSCHVWIQKTAGCNHMHCRLCKAHICWICLAKYRIANDVYEHLRAVHGGVNQDLRFARGLQMQVNEVNTIREDVDYCVMM
jgi:hypothetical protein